MKKRTKLLFLSLCFLVFIVALVVFYSKLRSFNYNEVRKAFKIISINDLALASFLTLLYYLILGGYDFVAFRYIRTKTSLKLRNILFTSFISNIFGNNIGCSMLFGGSIRYRLYSIYNISILDITKVIFFSSITNWIGLLIVGGFIFTFYPISLNEIISKMINLNLPINSSTRIIGLFFITILSMYIFLSIFYLKPIKVFRWTITFPNIKIVFLQILFATCDWLIASSILYFFFYFH